VTAEDLLARLDAADPRERDEAAAGLGDLLRGAAFDQRTTERVVAALVALALRERDRTVTEQALYSIGEAGGRIPLRVVEPLVARMSTLDNELVGYVLDILGSTRDPTVRPVLDRFVADPDPAVRRSAEEAIAELG
jgi:HEAT repeat protein